MKKVVGRPQIGPQITLRIPEKMLADIAMALEDGEDRATFIRSAIQAEIDRRRRDDG